MKEMKWCDSTKPRYCRVRAEPRPSDSRFYNILVFLRKSTTKYDHFLWKNAFTTVASVRWTGVFWSQCQKVLLLGEVVGRGRMGTLWYGHCRSFRGCWRGATEAKGFCWINPREYLSILNHVLFSSLLFCPVNTGLLNSVSTTTPSLLAYIFCVLYTAE
jgi:hypothetical protein